VADYDPARLSLVERAGFQDPVLAQIGFALWRELEQRAPAGRLYAQTATQLLAVHLLRHYTSAAGHIRTPIQVLTRRQVMRVTDYIRAHLSEDLSLDVLAQQVGFSPYHFARLFRQTPGKARTNTCCGSAWRRRSVCSKRGCPLRTSRWRAALPTRATSRGPSSVTSA